MNAKVIIWHRWDLRIHDHEPLSRAIQAKLCPIPVYCLDPRHLAQTQFDFPKTGVYRSQFLQQSLANLRSSYQSLGSNLITLHGLPEQIIPKIAQATGAQAVYFYREVTAEETKVERALELACAKLDLKLKTFWGSTLYHLEDLPFKIANLPELFTTFRTEVEKDWKIRPCFPTPTSLPPIPTDYSLGEISNQSVGNVIFKGGETEGKKRLNHYFWKTDSLRNYKETRNGMLGLDYSSKFSAWLALGCLSPRYIYDQVKAYETKRVKNQSTYWLIFELLWRDFFRFIALKHGNKIFQSAGLQGIEIPWRLDYPRFELWCQGKTGYPLVDANMKELAATGFMSNRGRQNVASFLTKNLGIDWRLGAEWFESLLIDYDVCSNWGNWNYSAGVGNDARGFRYFNIPKQSRDYDPQGEYLRYWLPELAAIPGQKIHEPWKLSQQEQQQYHVKLGVDYPNYVVEFFSSVKNCEQVYLNAVSKKR